MTDSGKQKRIEEFLRKSLLGEELVNTQFHLFSARSSPSGRVFKPCVLCANNVLLAKSSKYFLDLLSSDINPSDPSLVDLMDDNDVPSNARMDDYGYGSDSDLDDCNDPIPIANIKGVKGRKDRPTTLSASLSKIGAKTRSKDDDELSEDGSESDSSDLFVMSPEQPSIDEPRSIASSETAVQETGNKTLVSQTAVRLRSLASRHVLVKDTAFQTWYTLLTYLYTDKFNFLPLSSATLGRQPPEASTSSLDEPRCSAKSMYRLACKVELDHLREEAFSYIRSNLTEHNILKELSCSIVSKHPQLLEMELDMLYSHIASPPVVANFPALAKRIANNELSHGADIIVGIHARLLKEPQPLPFKSATPAPFSFSQPAESVELNVSGIPEAEVGDETGPSNVGEQGVWPGPPGDSWGSIGAVPGVPQAQAPASTSFFGIGPKVGGKATEKAVPQTISLGVAPTPISSPPFSNTAKVVPTSSVKQNSCNPSPLRASYKR